METKQQHVRSKAVFGYTFLLGKAMRKQGGMELSLFDWLWCQAGQSCLYPAGFLPVWLCVQAWTCMQNTALLVQVAVEMPLIETSVLVGGLTRNAWLSPGLPAVPRDGCTGSPMHAWLSSSARLCATHFYNQQSHRELGALPCAGDGFH